MSRSPKTIVPESGLSRPGDEVEKGRLARPVRSDDRVPVARVDGEVDPVHRSQAAERFAQALDLEERLAALNGEVSLHRFDLRDAGDLDVVDRLARALDDGWQLLPPVAGAEPEEELGQRGEAAGCDQHDRQHDQAEDEVEELGDLVLDVRSAEAGRQVGELACDPVVEQGVDEGTEGRAEEGAGAAEQGYDHRLRVGGPVEHLRVGLLLEHREQPTRDRPEDRADGVDRELVRLDVDADRAGPLPVLADGQHRGAEGRPGDCPHHQQAHDRDREHEVVHGGPVGEGVRDRDRVDAVVATQRLPAERDREEHLRDRQRQQREVEAHGPERDQSGDEPEDAADQRHGDQAEGRGQVEAGVEVADRVGADSVVGGVREGDHPRVAQHQVVGRRPQRQDHGRGRQEDRELGAVVGVDLSCSVASCGRTRTKSRNTAAAASRSRPSAGSRSRFIASPGCRTGPRAARSGPRP